MQQVVFESQFERISATPLPVSMERQVIINTTENPQLVEVCVVRKQLVCFENRMNEAIEDTFMAQHVQRLHDECGEIVTLSDGQVCVTYVAAMKHQSVIVDVDMIAPEHAADIAQQLSESFQSQAEQNFEYRVNLPLVLEVFSKQRVVSKTPNLPVLETVKDEIAKIVFENEKVVEEPLGLQYENGLRRSRRFCI